MKILRALALLPIAALANASESATLQTEKFAADKHAHKVEKAQVVQNPDGTTKVTGVLVYDDGTRESCVWTLMAKPAPGNRLAITPKSQTCTPLEDKAPTDD
ncbi:hypothetical protein NPS53_08185 [Pseudomonas putida]|uniref:hypothetical protein n=1 Tax=Pseudomonas putida TaxID=303 RepID=UPI0023635EB5|nr:hypothetical protein [Pseudomonas putida]MDD2139549.1 hypothetical protein [Pseudomonas putida]HDS1721472.1 hypothetical protein [Pseudomonas putida]